METLRNYAKLSPGERKLVRMFVWAKTFRWRNRKPRKGEVTMAVKITRKDGTVEDLGVVSRGKTTWKPEAR